MWGISPVILSPVRLQEEKGNDEYIRASHGEQHGSTDSIPDGGPIFAGLAAAVQHARFRVDEDALEAAAIDVHALHLVAAANQFLHHVLGDARFRLDRA